MKALIHVGSNDGREYLGTDRYTLLIEAWGDVALRAAEMHKGNEYVGIANFVVGSKYGTTLMYRADNNAESSSVLKPKKHLEMFTNISFTRYDIIMPVVPLDSITAGLDIFNELVIDVQGYELEVLKGATETLKSIEKIKIEVNKGEVYEGCSQFEDVVKFLEDAGFKLDHVDWYKPEWGDAYFVRP